MKITSIDELIGALKAHEIHLASRQIIKSNAGKALKVDEPKCSTQEDSAQRRRKSKALKVNLNLVQMKLQIRQPTMRLLSCPGSSSRYSRRKEDPIVSLEKTDDLPDGILKKTQRR